MVGLSGRGRPRDPLIPPSRGAPPVNDYLPTVFDRLTEPDFRNNQCRYTFQEMEARVLRDLEDLLNTRRAGFGLYPGLEAVERSVVNFGLRDFSHLNASSDTQRIAYADHVRQTIEAFDPRLVDVEVTARSLDSLKSSLGSSLKLSAMYFRVKATLRLGQGVAEPVVFDTLFDASLGRHTVTGSGESE